MRRAAKSDANQPALIALARRLGAACWEIRQPVDWLVIWQGRVIPMEIKNPDGRDEYTAQQVDFMKLCRERGATVFTWRTEGDVLRDLGAKICA